MAPLLRFAQLVFLILLTVLTSALCSNAQTGADWPVYNGGLDGDHYSPLTQINRENVQALEKAWTYDTNEQGSIQTNPLIVGRTLYGYTPKDEVIALDAATGNLKWKFDSGIVAGQPARGLVYWNDGEHGRIYAGVMNFLYCLDADTGHLINSFGESGHVDLRRGLGIPGVKSDFSALSIALTTPGVVYKNLIIVGGRNPEAKPSPPGYIQAFDLRTGELRWTFHTIPVPGEPGYETWPKEAYKDAGAANNWCGMALDAERGIVYVPTGSAVMDFYGGDRVGNDLYANSLLALDANTGKRIWHFQGVHHDIWDRDFPSPPALFSIERDGKKINGIAQPTKQGYLYLFNRENGEPLFPIHEHAYPKSDVPGEVTAPTQPKPDLPEPYARQELSESILTSRTPAAHDWALKTFHTFRNGGQFYPFAAGQQTVIFPGFDGGAEWGGPAIDPVHGVIYINATEMVWTGAIAPSSAHSPGEALYQSQCAMCHGMDRAGSPPTFPSLVNISGRLPNDKVVSTIQHGIGRMPSFPDIKGEHLESLLTYLRGAGAAAPPREMEAAPAPQHTQSSAVDPEGAKVYMEQCATCHGEKLEGIQPAPSLIGIGARLNASQVAEVVQKGKGDMPPADAKGAQLEALMRFLEVGTTVKRQDANPDEFSNKYIFSGYRKFLDPDGYPAITPPWGTLNAIDLKTGKYLWKVPLGQYPALAKQGMADTGSENYGGPVVTASGVLFIGATVHDHMFRAFDTSTGKVLWQTELPFSGVATPATYSVDGRQYVVIAASNARTPNEPQGGMYVAFALPAEKAKKH
ncbi:c-type cytochrome [Occallatibacter savannae]|uniref:c-type cytochrome n=1 Tax=Occallatibacter savannae TaxID=1002691 RepID=UPI000D6910C8|nr:c-type cytochrome [Occallatibacter savannae]